MVDPTVVSQYLAAFDRLVRETFEPSAPRRTRSTRITTRPLPGINFILDLEHEVTQHLARLGDHPALGAMTNTAMARRLIQEAFLQEYLVTCRFIDTIAPLLSKRFPDPLRESVHRYFAEEIGHETFERENCLRLGLTPQHIDDARPLLLHLAFVDILTVLARESPISFFCASMFTEGLIGSHDSLVSLALQALPNESELVRGISEHAELNEEIDHRGVGRDWMSRVLIVDETVQHEVSEMLAYLAELNWRMWQQLVRFVTAGTS